ncbi:MAG TPA: histidine kinase, partial [Anaerolineae bacterium]|nr:histidine kinase [Anaerolineae bacterium]
MSRLIPAIDTLTPQRTVIQLLRIMLLIDIAPAIIGAIYLSLRFDPNVGLPALLLAFPTSIVLIVLVLPGLDRRFGRYYIPLCLGLTIAAQVIESWLPPLLATSFQFQQSFIGQRPGGFTGVSLETRFGEPLLLLLVVTILGAWVYGRRGAWLTTGFTAIMLMIGAVVEALTGNFLIVRGGNAIRSEITPLAFILPNVIQRILLLAVTGYIVGLLVEHERKQSSDLLVANTKLHEQAGAVEQLATARERNRLARDLHDTLAHSLAGLVVQTAAIDTLMDSEPAAARSELTKARSLAQAGLKEARQAIIDLRTNPVEDLGLARALTRTANDIGDRAGVKTDLQITEPQSAISNDIGAQILRIAQEAFNNIEQHADAKRVRVSLSQA